MRKNRGVNLKTKLKEILLEKGISQRELAAKCGVSEYSISHFCKSGTHLGFGTLCKISDFLSIRIDELRGDNEHDGERTNQGIS